MVSMLFVCFKKQYGKKRVSEQESTASDSFGMDDSVDKIDIDKMHEEDFLKYDGQLLNQEHVAQL